MRLSSQVALVETGHDYTEVCDQEVFSLTYSPNRKCLLSYQCGNQDNNWGPTLGMIPAHSRPHSAQ